MAGQEFVADMDASISSCKEGPVLTMVNKRLRALKKKYNRILQIEESKAQGKQINKEQEEVLKGKLAVTILIEEYEKLRPSLMVAVKEEIDKELLDFRLKKEESIAGDEEHVNVPLEEKENVDAHVEKGDTHTEVGEENVDVERLIVGDESSLVEKSNNVSEDEGTDRREPVESTGTVPFEREVNDLLHLVYFAQLFDVPLAEASPSIVWTKIHERSSCISYDCVTEEDSSSPLEESDLNDLSLLGSLITSRPPNATFSHRDALQQCMKHALLWLGHSDSPIKEGLRVTYSHLRERLNRILSSEYYIMTPELQTIGQQTVPAAASVSGQYPPQLLIHAALSGAGPSYYYASQDAPPDSLLQGGEHFTPALPVSNLVPEPLKAHLGINPATAYVPELTIPVQVDVEAATGFTISMEEQEQDVQFSASTEPPQTGTGQEPQEQQQEFEATNLTSDLKEYQGPNGGVVPGNSHVRARSVMNSRGGYGISRGGQGNGRGTQPHDQKVYYPRSRGSGRGMGASGSSRFNGYGNGQANNRTSGATLN